MAPRRLILAMIFLLSVSTVIAILAPNPSDPERSPPPASENRGEQGGEPRLREGSTGPPGPRPDRQKDPAVDPSPVREATIEVGGPVETIRAGRGERLIVEVRSADTVEVAIPALGRIATTDRWAPAVFDLVAPDRRETLEVTELQDQKRVARIVVG